MTDDSNSSEGNNGGDGKSRHGFASWDPAKRKRVAAKGGRAAHAVGSAHQFTSEEAKAAGRKGGIAVHALKKARERAAAKEAKLNGEEVE